MWARCGIAAGATARRHRAGGSVAQSRPELDPAEDWNTAASGRPFDRLERQFEPQAGDAEPTPFSFLTEKIDRPQVKCHIAYTTEETHRILREAIPRSPLYSGQIEGVGPRYCPSIEDKVVKFPDKLRHQIFLEPEGLDTNEVYVNGMSTSMPIDASTMVTSVPGLEQAEMISPGIRH